MLFRSDADVALRASNTPPDVLVGRRISTIAGAVYGPRSLADKPGLTPLTYDGPWVGFGDPIQNTTGAKWVKANIPPEQIVVKVNGMIGLVEAVAAGLGVALLPCFTGEMRPDLVRIGDPIPEAASSLWLLTHPDLRRSARVRVFMDFFGAEISKMKHQLGCVGAIPSR